MTELKRKHRLHVWQWVVIGLATFLIGAVIVFAGYFLYNSVNSLPANTNDIATAKQNTAIQVVDKGSYYAVLPSVSSSNSAVIFYPGAFVEPSAYIGRYAELAQKGIAVFIVRSPFNFALLDVNRADRIMRENPDITKWYVAGHSLGGVAACEYAKSHQAKLSGLILLASYCNGNATSLTIPVLSISGTRDGLATPQKITDSKKNLPASAQFVSVEGANHTVFGSFARMQLGDNPATVTETNAEQQIINAISGFITLPAL